MPDKIDENLLRDLMAGNTPASKPIQETENPPVTDPRVETKNRKKGTLPEYVIFLKPGNLQERQSVYISKENQEIINRIVNLLGSKNLTIGTYIDNVLNEHFAVYHGDIKTLLEKEYSKNILKK